MYEDDDRIFGVITIVADSSCQNEGYFMRDFHHSYTPGKARIVGELVIHIIHARGHDQVLDILVLAS